MFNNAFGNNENSHNFFSDLNMSCSFAMDDGGRCLLDVINDPLLLQSFLESGSDENSKDPQDGTSSESAVESPQVSRSSHASLSNHLSSAEHIVEQSEAMGYSYAVDNPGLLSQSGLCSTSSGLGGVSLVVASSVGPQTYQHASSSGATIHHMPSAAHNLHPHSPASRPATPLSSLNIKSPGQGPSSVHSMPPPSPLQQTRSPLPSHTPSPAPAWSPAPPVLSPAPSRTQSSMPSVAFQQSHNQILQTSCSVTQFVTALATQQSLSQKLHVQQQQQLFLQQQLSPVSQQQATSRLTSVTSPVVTTTAVAVTPPMVQLISAPQSNVSLPVRTSHTNVRPIQPKLPPQILPKPATCSASNQFVTPAPATKQAPPTPVTAGQRTMGVGIQPNAAGQLVIGQGQSGVFSGHPGTILLNQIIPGMGQSPILIQGNLSNLANVPGLQLTLRPPNSASPHQLNSSNPQNNATLIAALQGPSQHAHTLFAQAKSPLHGQQTIVIPNNLTHAGIPSQNINLTSAAIPNSGIMSSSSPGQSFLRSNIILSPRVVGTNQGQQGFQLQQIQTPQGPIFACIPSQAIAVPHLQNATLGNAQLAPVTLPTMHGVMATGQGVISGLSLQSHAPQSALQQQQQQSLFGTAVPFTSQLEQPSHQVIQVPQPLAPPQVPTNHPSQISNQHPQPVEHSPKPPSPPKPSKVPSVNLEELLKEHGIVPENSPPPSPDSNSPVMEETVSSHMQTSNTIVPSPQQLITALQSQQVVLEQLSQSPQGPPTLPQLKLALAQDGSVILQQHNAFSGTPRVQQFVPSPQVQARTVNNNVGSVIMPTATTAAVSVPSATSESSTTRNHSTLIARLNAGPAITVPDVSSLAIVSNIGCTTTSITTTTITTTATTLVPLTVQSTSMNNIPIVSTGYVVHRTNAPISSERVFYSEDTNNAQNNVTSVISSTAQSVQNRIINHVNSGYQTVVVSSSESAARLAMQSAPKTVQSTHMGNVSTSNSISIVQAELDKSGHTRVVEIADNSGATVPSHNLPAFSPNVPNQMLQKLQKEINDLSSLKYRSAEQQKALQHLVAVQKKFCGPKSGKGSRTVQNQVQVKQEPDIEKFVQRTQASQNPVISNPLISNQLPQQQMQMKPVLPQQPTVDSCKQQISTNSKPSNAHNMHLVNLLKQAPQSASAKHSPPVTTCATSVNEIITTTVSSTVAVSTHPRIVNQVVPPAQQRIQTVVHQAKQQPQSPQPPQQQVIVRVPKPTPQPESVRTGPNIIQLKGVSPVKKVINTVPKTVLINERLSKDQNRAVCPDLNTPFQSKADACQRLLSYHVLNSKVPSVVEIAKADETFDLVSVQLMEKMRKLKHKYQFLKLKDSMRPCATPDQVLLERLFIKDEEESLKDDKATVAEGKVLTLPPPPANWKIEMNNTSCDMPPPLTSCRADNVHVKQEVEENDGHSTEYSDSMREDSDPAYKDDDNLEAPVIDSCADIVVPQHDDNCERSPPTLKRIVIKPEKLSESDSEEPVTNKRFKYNNYIKYEPNSDDRGLNACPLSKSSVFKESDKEPELKTNHKYHPVPLTRESFHSDNRIDDMVTKIRKELDMSPMETDDDDLDTVSSHVVDFEPPSGTNDLADFEPPVARTEESCDSNLLYNNSVRTNCEIKYDFEMLGCSVWDENYAHHPSNESNLAVGSMVSDHGTPSDLDLSGLDGLEDHLEESQHCIPNGIQDISPETEVNYIGYRIPKHQKRFPDVSAQPTSNCSNTTDQVQSAIKSIMGTPADNRSYFGADEMEFLPISKQSHNTHTADYGRSLDTDVGVTSSESDAALDEAVRSILLR